MRNVRLGRPGARDDERGFVIVWMTVVLVLLLSVAAFAVDLVHAYVEAEQAQNAADAAALAGATLVNDNPDCIAPSARATQLANDNGFSAANTTDTDDVHPECSGANEMTVTVKRTFSTFFARIMGFDKLTVKRTAAAQYDAPITMGSAANWLGNVPVCPDGSAPNLNTCLNAPASFAAGFVWASIQAPDGTKSQGNSIVPTHCQTTDDHCSSGTNTDSDPDGEYFLIHNPKSDAGADLDIWLYDAGFVGTQPACDRGNGTGIDKWSGNILATYDNPAWCTGDSSFGASTQEPPINTTFEILKPPAVPSGDFKHYPQASCANFGAGQPPMIPGHGYGHGANGDDNAANAAFDDIAAQPYFHQWQNFCHINAAVEGDYVIHVTAQSVSNSKGSNQFGIMGLHTKFGMPIKNNRPGDLTVFSRDQLPIAAVNPPSGLSSSKFYLARVQPSKRERHLVLSFFDLGDTTIGNINNGTLKIETQGVLGNFTTRLQATNGHLCQWVEPPTSGTTTQRQFPFPKGAFNETPNGGKCQVDYDSNFGPTPPPASNLWDGRWVSIDIRLPGSDQTDGYDCLPADRQNCWFTMSVEPAAGAGLSDATVWSAHISGGPVSLVTPEP